MMSKLLSKKGFTLIELMIAVAIIAILAAVAIPNFLRYQKRSRRSEGELVLNGIMKAQKSTKADTNVFYEATNNGTTAGAQKYSMNWYDTTYGFTEIGYVADEYVYCSYACITDGTSDQQAICNASCDIDADSTPAEFGVAMADEAGGYDIAGAATTLPAITACSGTSGPTDDRDGNPKLETVVRCTTGDVF